MYRALSWVAAALLTFGIATASASADDSACNNALYRTLSDEAIAACSRLIARNPRNAVAYSNRGVAYNVRGDNDRAIADYDQAIRLNPSYAAAYSNRCNAYKDKGDYEQAIADCDRAIRLDPSFANAYITRGETYEAKHDLDLAIADFDRALRLDPSVAAQRGRRRVQALLTASQPSPAHGQAQLPPQTSPLQPAASPIPGERRVALVIGNSGYTSGLISALPNPRRDATLVADALRQAGF
jgi:tetratricopeptide (TPR) repeat protein